MIETPQNPSRSKVKDVLTTVKLTVNSLCEIIFLGRGKWLDLNFEKEMDRMKIAKPPQRPSDVPKSQSIN